MPELPPPPSGLSPHAPRPLDALVEVAVAAPGGPVTPLTLTSGWPGGPTVVPPSPPTGRDRARDPEVGDEAGTSPEAAPTGPVVRERRRRPPRRGSAAAWRTREAVLAHCETQCPPRGADGRPAWLEDATHDELEAARVFLTRVDLAARYDAAWEEYEAQQAGLAAAVHKCRVYTLALELGEESLDTGSLESLRRDLRSAELAAERKAAAPWASVRSLRAILMEHRLRDACQMAAKRWARRRTELLAELEGVDTYLLEAGAATVGFLVFGVTQALVGAGGMLTPGGGVAIALALVAAAWTYRPRAVARGRRIAALHAELGQVEAFEAACRATLAGGGAPGDGALNEHEQRLVIGSPHQRGGLASLGGSAAAPGAFAGAEPVVSSPTPVPPTPELAAVAARWALTDPA